MRLDEVTLRASTDPRFLARFWPKVAKSAEPNGCWLWTASVTIYGYGQINLPKVRRPGRAHRISWIIAHGAIPDGMEVCHNCPGGDVARCVNPAHLFLGTHGENMRDMSRKGRNGDNGLIGEQHGCAILTDAKVVDIRARYAAGALQQTLADEYGVDRTTIGMVVRGRTWIHLLDH